MGATSCMELPLSRVISYFCETQELVVHDPQEARLKYGNDPRTPPPIHEIALIIQSGRR